MISRDLIVPFRKHTLKECDEIIRSSQSIDRSPRKTIKKISEVEIWQEWIDSCLNESSKRLTSWEENFLISINDYLTMRGFLTEDQVKILERIYTEKV